MAKTLLRANVPLLLSATLLTVTAAACSSADSTPASAPDVAASGPLAASFASAAEKASVPRDLLVAIAQVEGGLTMPAERPDLDETNEVPAAGPLQLRRGKLDTLARGAHLVSASELDLRIHADLALEAGALVLAELGAKTRATADLGSWKTAIEEMSGLGDDPHRESYAHQVFATLARGGRFEGRDGETIILPAHPEIPPSLTLDISDKLKTLANAEYPGAEWFPTSCTNKCTPGRAGNPVQFIVVHDTEGGWNASVATLQNDPNKSVQYIIDVDGRVGQFVTEGTTAWHAGNFHYNQRSIGIEHVGYSTKPYPEPLYAASVKLVNHLTAKYRIPKDRAHIIGHDQIPNGNRIALSSPPCAKSPRQCVADPNYGGSSKHSDPGVWEWSVFMHRIAGAAKCNDAIDLWSCNSDKTYAARCAGGKVEVKRCDGGCRIEADGTDDTCNVEPAAVDPEPTPATPPGPAGDDESPGSTRAPSPAPPSADVRAPRSDDSGCSTAPGRGSSTGTPLALLVLAASVTGTVLRRARARNAR